MRAAIRLLALFGFVATLWSAGVRAEASDTPVQFDVPLAPYCLAGTFPCSVRSGTTTVQGTLELTMAGKGLLTGTLTVGIDVVPVTGRQVVKKGQVAVTLASASGPKLKLSGSTKNGTLAGSISGSTGTAALPPRSTFSADISSAAAMVARCALTVTSDDVTGVLSGAGTATFCGVADAVTLTGKSTLPAVLASTKAKKATAKLTLKGTSFTWTGKGSIVLEDDSTSGPGYVVSWSAAGGGAKSKGKNLRVASPPAPGPSPGHFELTGPVATSFNVRIIDVVVNVADARPSVNPADFTVTDNGTPVTSAIRVDAAARTLTLPKLLLADGRNRLEITGKDSFGLDLAGTVTVWAGTSALQVNVTDEQAAPVAGANVSVMLGDDHLVAVSGTTDAAGAVTFQKMPNWTVIVEATGAANTLGSAADLGSAGTIGVVLHGFGAASQIDNNDFGTGDAAGWDTDTSPVTVEDHVETVGPTKIGGDKDLKLATSGEGPQRVSRTFITRPSTVAVKLRYRFVTTEVPGGYFGTEYNDYFSVSIRSQAGGGRASESNTMNGLGLAAFDASGATKWREVLLPVSVQGDIVQVDVTVANVADGILDSFVFVDRIQETSIDLTVAEGTRSLLETNRFEIVVDPPGGGSDFKIEIRRASEAQWYLLSSSRVVDSYKHRTAGTFRMRGTATVDGVPQASAERDLVVQFPTYASIVADAAVVTMTDASWTSTKNAANATTRREEGCFILLNTNTGVAAYQASATVIGPLVGPMQTGSVNIVKPADNPATPTPLQASIYAVASFHTHTPTAFRPVGRAIGPSAADQTADTADGVPGIVYDYVGDAAGIAPAGHPLNSPAQRYASGPARRATPP